MPPQPHSPPIKASDSSIRPNDLIFRRMALNYACKGQLTVNSASEEHGDAEVSLKIMGGFFLAEQIDVEQVIAKIGMKSDRIV